MIYTGRSVYSSGWLRQGIGKKEKMFLITAHENVGKFTPLEEETILRDRLRAEDDGWKCPDD